MRTLARLLRTVARCMADQAWSGLVVLATVTVFQVGAAHGGAGARPSVEWSLERSAAGVALAALPDDLGTRRMVPDLMRSLAGPRSLPGSAFAGWVALLVLAVAWAGAVVGGVAEAGLRRAGMAPGGAHVTALASWTVPVAVVPGHMAHGLLVAVAVLLVVTLRGPPRVSRVWARAVVTVLVIGLATVPVVRTARALPWALDVRPPVQEAAVVRHPQGPPPSHRPGPDWKEPVHTGVSAAERVILITVDTLGARHMGLYDGSRPTTPRLSEWMERAGVVFERNYASAPWTLPSTTTLLTSLHPQQHGLEGDGLRLSEDVPTLAGAFASQGFHTAGFATHIYASSRFGLDSGFHEFWEFSIDPNFREGRQLRAEQLNARVRDWLDQHGNGPFFLYLHYFDPHWDYEPPTPFDERFTDAGYGGRARGTYRFLSPYIPTNRLLRPKDVAHVEGLYDGEVAYTDHALGSLFEALRERGLMDGTAIAVVADHGEEFQEHGSFGHTRTVYEELIHVPLLLLPPGGRPSGWRARVSEQVRNLDVAPTLLELAGCSIPPGFEGRSLLPLVRGPGAHRDAFARTTRQADAATVISDRWKLIRLGRGGSERLFDLREDPAEQRDVAAEHPERVQRLGALLDRWLQDRPDERARHREVDLTAAERKQLEALGYAH